jgi:parvulin-like peptidyl-prolyl isomerase
LFLTALVGCTGASVPLAPSADLAATVNDRAITRSEVARLARNAHGTGGAVAEKAVLEALVSQELAAQQAEELQLLPDEAGLKELARAEAELNAVRRRVLSSALYAKEELRAAEVSAADARTYFAAHEKDLRTQAHLKMVMRRSAAELEQMKAALEQGTPFDTYAQGLLPPGVPGRPWDLGYVGWAQMPSPWRKAVRALKPGEVSAVLPGDHGRYWLLQLVDTHEGPQVSLDAALPLIRQAVAVERGSAARDALDTKLRQHARIVYTPPPPEPVASASDE